jgi:dTDP-4-amino-4,6-dideoxygalactose transaminase
LISLFHPYVPEEAIETISNVLRSKQLAQGSQVDLFEKKFGEMFNVNYPVSVNSGTSALETAYDLLHLGEEDEVISTPLTCVATNMPLLHRRCKIVWADIRKDTLTLDREDVERKITPRTKAIVNVHLGGIESSIGSFYLDGKKIPTVADSCQALGIFTGDYVACSFQAIKHITTGDGGMLVCPTEETFRRAKLLRWFGIDRDSKETSRLINLEPKMLGYKRHMNDVDATLGLGGLKDYHKTLLYRKQLFNIYRDKLKDILVDGENNVYWTATVIVENRDELQRYLKECGVETDILHIRNDIYKIFGGYRQDLTNLNEIENKYLSLPLHPKLSVWDVNKICNLIKGW